MAQYGFPTSDISKVNWSQLAGDGDGSAFDELDEGIYGGTPDDAATAWQTDNINNVVRTIECKLGAVSDPLIHTSHIISARCRKNTTGGAVIGFVASLYQGTTLIASSSSQNLDTTWTTVDYILTEAEAAAITDFTDLRIRVVATFAVGTSRRAQISAMELAGPSPTHVLTASPLTTGSAALGTPALGQKHALTATGLATGAASLASPALGQKHALTAAGLTTGAATLGTPAPGQVHALSASALSTGAATLGAPVLAEESGTDNLTAAPLTTGAATLGAPALGQTHALAAAALTTGGAVLGAPALGQVHGLAAVGLTTGAAVLGSPALAQSHAIAATGLATGPAVLGAPALGQAHTLTAAGLATGLAIFGAPTLSQTHAFAAAGLATGPAQFGSPALGQVHVFSAPDLTTGPAVFGLPTLTVGHVLLVVGLITGPVILGTPALVEIVAVYEPAPADRRVRVGADGRQAFAGAGGRVVAIGDARRAETVPAHARIVVVESEHRGR